VAFKYLGIQPLISTSKGTVDALSELELMAANTEEFNLANTDVEEENENGGTGSLN
jgi:hypothetical protein